MLRIEFEQNLAANEQAGNVISFYFFWLTCSAGSVQWDTLVESFPKPICFTVTKAAARKSVRVVYPVIAFLIVRGFGWGSLYVQRHKDVCLSLYLNDYQQHHLSFFLSGPINREMRHLISSLQNHNHQLKGDVQRYKRKLRETQMEINKVLLILAFIFGWKHSYKYFSHHQKTKTLCCTGIHVDVTCRMCVYIC